MASYYSRRPIFANTIPGHLPRPRYQEPDTRLGDLPLRQSDNSYASTAPVAPPPAYVGAGLPLSRTVSSGATLVSNGSSTRRSRVVKVKWSYHPALSGKGVWLHRLPRFLRRDRETLDPDFPAEFSELLTSTGQAGEEHEGALKVRELWQARVSHLNTWVIPDRLVATRFWTALMEVSCIPCTGIRCSLSFCRRSDHRSRHRRAVYCGSGRNAGQAGGKAACRHHSTAQS